MKTSELTGAALDWAVAKCEGLAVSDRATKWRAENCPHLYSTDWAQGGPIIEREWVDLHCVNDSLWEAECPAVGGLAMQNGPTPLIAAMRCYVASKLGHDVDVPEELCPPTA
jgi:hypothetical protein